MSMDAINSNYSQFAANFASRLGQTGAVTESSRVGGGAEVSSGSQIRMREANDKVGFVLSHPELAESANLTGSERAELLQSTSEKAVSAQIMCRGNAVMFDIYAVLALIQKTSQEMRNAQRDLRKAEVASITSSILAQAEMQRAAAITQLVTGCVTAGISGAMVVGSFAGMGKSMAQTNAAQKAAGLPQMEQQQALTLAEGKPLATKANLADLKGTVPKEMQAEVDVKMKEAGAGKPLKSEANVTAAEQELQAANEGVTAAEGKVKLATNESKAAQAESDKAADAIGDGGTVDDALKASDELDVAKGNKVNAEKELSAAKDVVAEKQAKLDGAMSDAADARAAKLEKVVDGYQQEFDKATTKASKEFTETGKVSEATQAEVETAGQKLNYARAVQLNECANLPVKPTTAQTAFAKVNAMVKQIKAESSPTSAQYDMQKAMMIGQSAQMVSQLGSSVGQGIAGIFQAEGTELQAVQKQAEEQLDQIKDLFNNTQQVIQQSIQIFQSVTSKESQSVEEIIGGIKA